MGRADTLLLCLDKMAGPHLLRSFEGPPLGGSDSVIGSLR